MKKNRIKLSENDLHKIIKETIEEVINDSNAPSEAEELEEGWFGDKWDQTKSAVKAGLANKQDNSFSGRFNRAKKNWSNIGKSNELVNARKDLMDLVKKYNLDTNKTIKDLIGYGDENDKMSGLLNNKAMGNRGAARKREIGR